MINNCISKGIKERDKFLKNLISFLEKQHTKYDILVYIHIYNTCFYFHYCNDSIKAIASYLHIGNNKVIQAIDYLVKNQYISDKPYMILDNEKDNIICQ